MYDMRCYLLACDSFASLGVVAILVMDDAPCQVKLASGAQEGKSGDSGFTFRCCLGEMQVTKLLIHT